MRGSSPHMTNRQAFNRGYVHDGLLFYTAPLASTYNA
jgi:hypothetical protein